MSVTASGTVLCKEGLDSVDKSPNLGLTRDSTEIAKETNVSFSVIASQLRVAITYQPNNDMTFKDLSCVYHGFLNEITPMIQDFHFSTVPCCANKLHDIVDTSRTIIAGLMKEYCTRKKLDKTISAMKKEKKLPNNL